MLQSWVICQEIHNIMLEQSSAQSDERTILESIGLISKRMTYQIYLMAFLGLAYHIFSVTILTPALLFNDPVFKCDDLGEGIDEETACPILQFCTLQNEATLTAKLGLYCGGRKNGRSLILSAFGLGNVFGVLIVNWLADRKGKKYSIILSLAIGTFHAYCLLFGVLNHSIEMIILSQFVSGFCFSSFTTLVFFIASKYMVGEYSKYVVVFFYLCGTGTGQLTLAFIHQYSPGWQTYLVFVVVSYTLLLVAAPFIVREDPVFLYNSGKMDELMQLIEGVGTTNRATVQQMQAAENLLSHINKYRLKRSPSITQLIPQEMLNFKSVLLILIMACASFTTSSVYYGIGFAMDKFAFTVTESLLVFGAAEIINYVLVMILMPCLPSIPTVLFTTAIISTAAGLSFFTETVSNSYLLQMIAIVTLRFFVITYGCFYISYYVEELPKKIEGTSAGMIQCLGSTGKIFAPLAVRMANDRHMNPMGIFGLTFFFVGLLPFLLLPKTKNNPEDPISKNNQIQ